VGLHREYRLPPVYITENGMAVNDKLVDGKVHDEARIEYAAAPGTPCAP
jgi:beta-glucosidase